MSAISNYGSLVFWREFFNPVLGFSVLIRAFPGFAFWLIDIVLQAFQRLVVLRHWGNFGEQIACRLRTAVRVLYHERFQRLRFCIAELFVQLANRVWPALCPLHRMLLIEVLDVLGQGDVGFLDLLRADRVLGFANPVLEVVCRDAFVEDIFRGYNSDDEVCTNVMDFAFTEQVSHCPALC